MEKFTFFKELTPHSRTYEFRSQGKKKTKKTREALSRAEVSPPGSVDHKSGSALYG